MKDLIDKMKNLK